MSGTQRGSGAGEAAAGAAARGGGPTATRAAARVAMLALLALAACSPTFRVQADYDRDADFGSLRTFAWLPLATPSGDPRVDSAILAGRVRRAVVADLKAKGYREVAPDASPDFYAAYQAAIDEKVSMRSTPTYYGYHGWWAAPPMASVTTVHTYEMGTLIIDIVDRERDDLIWRGSAQAKLRKNDTRSPEERDREVADAVAAILKDFPPPVR